MTLLQHSFIHRTWQWYYCKYNDISYQMGDDAVMTFICTTAHAGVRSWQEYYRGEDIVILSKHFMPASVILTGDVTIHRRSIGLPLAKTAIGTKTFWTYLKSLGGEWMWDNIQEGKIGVEWIKTALTNGSFIGVTDGLYTTAQVRRVKHFGVCSSLMWIFFLRN
jgi:hypothetical protein